MNTSTKTMPASLWFRLSSERSETLRPIPTNRWEKIRARRDELIVRCHTSPNATHADRLNVIALANPLLARIARAS